MKMSGQYGEGRALTSADMEKAEAGDVKAMLRVATHYTSSPQDTEKGLKWLERAADTGDAMGQFLLASAYKVLGEHEMALALCLKAVEQNLPDAQLLFAEFFKDGTAGQAIDKEKEIRWTENAADNGSWMAKCQMAFNHMAGNGVPKDKEKAIQLCEEALRIVNNFDDHQEYLFRNAKTQVELALKQVKEADIGSRKGEQAKVILGNITSEHIFMVIGSIAGLIYGSGTGNGLLGYMIGFWFGAGLKSLIVLIFGTAFADDKVDYFLEKVIAENILIKILFGPIWFVSSLLG
jgi:tetratricopeptide (TPR) repeat protein